MGAGCRSQRRAKSEHGNIMEYCVTRSKCLITRQLHCEARIHGWVDAAKQATFIYWLTVDLSVCEKHTLHPAPVSKFMQVFLSLCKLCQVECCMYREWDSPFAHWQSLTCRTVLQWEKCCFLQGSLCTQVTCRAVPLSEQSSRMEEHILGW